MKAPLFAALLLVTTSACAAPDGYIEMANNARGDKWFMHHSVTEYDITRGAAAEVNVVVDIWYEPAKGPLAQTPYGFKEAYNCDKPGVVYPVEPPVRSDEVFSRGRAQLFVRGSIGYALWDVGCKIAASRR